MPVSPARQIAFRVLIQVDVGRGYAVDLLQRDDVSRLSDADRRLTTEIVMGVLRWRGELDLQIQQLSGKPMKFFDPEVATILRMGIYQLQFLEKIPRSAAVNESVELTKAARKRSAAGLVNAVLRKCKPYSTRLAGTCDVLGDSQVHEAARRTLPHWLFERWERNFSHDGAMALAVASNQVPPTTLRTVAGQREAIRKALSTEGILTEPGRFSERALTVCSGNIHAAEILRSGGVVIQDEASQLVATLLAPRAGDRVLDLCAAPGIKTGQLAEDFRQGTLVACDLSGQRLRTMKWLWRGRTPTDVDLHLVRLDATSALPFAGTFDRILVDAPCSGTGTLARNPEIKWRLKPQDLVRLTEIQERILENALDVLASGGRLVYATCSLEPEENENVVEKALPNFSDCRLLTKDELAGEISAITGLFDSSGFLRTRPDLHGMDGFFAAVIVRERR